MKPQFKTLALLLLLSSCSMTAKQKHYERIHGFLTPMEIKELPSIKKQSGDTVALNGIAGRYLLRNDTLIRIK